MRFIDILVNDFKFKLRNIDIFGILLLGNIFLTLLFGGVYSHSFVEDIPIVVLDEDNSSLSRMITEQFQESGRFSIKYYVSSKQELQNTVNSRKAYMGLYIPYKFSSDIKMLRASEVLIVVDGTNVVVSNNAIASATSIVQTLAAGLEFKILQAKDVLNPNAINMATVFNFTDRTLCDPRLTYKAYLLLGFIAVFLQQVMLSGVGNTLIRNNKLNFNKSNTLKIMLANILVCALIAVFSAFISIIIAMKVFEITMLGSVLQALLFAFLFAIAIGFTATTIAALIKDKVKYAQFAFALSLPALVSCGYVWPQDQMPKLLVTIIKTFWPLIYFAKPFDELLIKGYLDFNNVLSLLIYIAIWMPISIMIVKYRFESQVSVEKI